MPIELWLILFLLVIISCIPSFFISKRKKPFNNYKPGPVYNTVPTTDASGNIRENIWTINISGVTHKHQGSNPQKIIPFLLGGEGLQLVPDPENKYDDTAIKVLTHDNRQIGWYPSKGLRADEQYDRLVNGEEVSAFVFDRGKTKGGEVWWCEIKIVVYKPAKPSPEPYTHPALWNSISAYYDELLLKAIDVMFETGHISVSTLQRGLKIGYSRSVENMDQLEELGIISAFRGSIPRQIIITTEQWENMPSSFFEDIKRQHESEELES